MRHFALKIFLPIFALLYFVFPTNAFALTNFQSGETVTLSNDQTIGGDYFVTGGNVTILGTVDGDLYAAGGTIILEGIVNGDVLVAGGNIVLNGEVLEDVRIFGGNITIDGKIGGNVTTGAGNVTISNDAEIGGNVTGGIGQLSIFAPIQGDLQVGAGSALIASTIGRDIVFAGDTLQLQGNAVVGRNMTYYSQNQAQVEEGVTINGLTTHNKPPQDAKRAQETARQTAAGFATFLTFSSFLTVLVLGLLAIRFVPSYTEQVANTMQSRFLPSFGIGLLTFIGTPILILVLFVTLLGIPLAVMLLLSFILLYYFAKVFAALLIGKYINERTLKDNRLWLIFVIGLFIYYLLGLIPILGGLTQFVLTLASIGGMLLTKKSMYEKLKAKKEL